MRILHIINQKLFFLHISFHFHLILVFFVLVGNYSHQKRRAFGRRLFYLLNGGSLDWGLAKIVVETDLE